ncbi:MAG: hypothetical protein ACREAT_08610 [Nitrosotalea sp.]
MEKNVCNVCGTDVNTANKIGCPVCEDTYFRKIKESYNQNLQRLNIVSKDLFNLYFDLSDESVKYSYEIINQYLEMEKNLHMYNPSLYYFLTTYQFLRNRLFGNTIQSVSMLHSNFMDIWKSNHSVMSKNIISMLENMNKLYNAYGETMNVKEKPRLTEENKNMIKVINDVNKIYNTYQKENKITKTDNSENVTRILKKE